MSEKNNKLKDIFETILGTKINLEPLKETKGSDKENFMAFIEAFEYTIAAEDDIYEMFNIDITSITTPHYMLIESLLLQLYPNQIAELILWYIYDRKDEEGNINAIEDENGNLYILKNSKDLWNFIQKFN